MKKLALILCLFFVSACGISNNNVNHGVKQLNNKCENNKLSDRFFCSVNNGQTLKLIFQSNCSFHHILADQNSSTPAIHTQGKWKLNSTQLMYTLNGQQSIATLIWSADDQSFTTIEDQKIFNRCN